MNLDSSAFVERVKQYQFFLQKLPGVLYVVDANGRYIFANDDTTQMSQTSVDKMIGFMNKDIYSHANALVLDANNFMVMQSTAVRTFEEAIIPKEKNKQLQFWLSVRKTIFTPDDEPLLVVNYSVNVTDRKKLDQELGLNFFDKEKNQVLTSVNYPDQYLSHIQNNEGVNAYFTSGRPIEHALNELDERVEADAAILCDFYNMILDHCPANIYAFNRDNSLIYHNSMQQFFNQQYLRQQKSSEFQNQFCPKEVNEKISELYNDKRVIDMVTLNNKKALNKLKTIQCEEAVIVNKQVFMSMKRGVVSPFTNQSILLGASVDYSLQKELEIKFRRALNKQKIDNEAKEAFITNISHDIRTPITGMLGLISEIKELSQGSPVISDQLQELEGVTNEFLSLFNGILKTVEEDETVFLSSNKTYFNLLQLIERCASMYRPVLAHRNIDLLIDASDDVPLHYYDNPMIIKRIVFNLLGNAVKFTHEGKISIHVDYDHAAHALILTVADTGIGIREYAHKIIFDRFTRLDLSAFSRYPGYGLGLFMVKKYVDLMKGKVNVTSRLGEGATFSLTLPMKPVSHVPEEDKPLVTRRPQTRMQPGLKKILLVEDNVLAARALQQMLESLQYEVAKADNGKKALDMARSEAFAVIFLDLGLPDQSGLDVLLSLRHHDMTKHTPIYMLSGHITNEMRLQCMEHGADGAYTKPMEKNALAELLEDLQSSVQ